MSSLVKILLVDDMHVILDIIASYLQEMDEKFSFYKATNGREACKIANQEMPDLIIMDWEMPGMNGFDALQLMKKNERLNSIPVIMSSGFSDSSSVKKALDAGAIDYIKKPIDRIELIARVKSTLRLTNSFNELRQKKNELTKEQLKVERILKGLLPQKILNELKETGISKPKRYKCASAMFTDLVGFTQKTTTMSPKRLINELNDIFSSFDKIINKYNCTRIKTIGDAYLAVAGLPEIDENHAKHLIQAAIEFRQFILERNMTNAIKWEITIGINSGDIIGSIIGLENYLFDVFGENVNTASRIQTHCSPMCIAVSGCTYNLTCNDFFFKKEGTFTLKGIKKIDIYHVMDVLSEYDLNEMFNNFDVF
jgi:DNA-binding response OmpR family regulator